MSSTTYTLAPKLHFVQYFTADTLYELMVEINSFDAINSDEQNNGDGLMIVSLNISLDSEAGWVAEAICFGEPAE